MSRLFLLTPLCLLAAATLLGADARPASRFVVVEPGVRIHYLERRPVGFETTPTLVFVPGWMLPREVWARQLSHFGSRYRALAIDPRSQGDSLKHLTERAMMMPTNSAIAAFFGSFTSDYRPALSKIDKPTLIVTARNAWMNHYEAMQQRIRGSRMEVVENEAGTTGAGLRA